jgi:steroid delta-isomerase-like uncharacterized protein
MSAEQNKTIIQGFINEGLNLKNPALIDEVYAPEYVGHDPERPQPRTVSDMHQTMQAVLGKVFPDAHYTTETLIAEGDMVAWRWIFTASYQSDLPNFPPASGQKVSFGGINLFRMTNGKIVEDWVYRDTMGMLRQLGALPPAGR